MRKQVRRNGWLIAGVMAGDTAGDTLWEGCALCQRSDHFWITAVGNPHCGEDTPEGLQLQAT